MCVYVSVYSNMKIQREFTCQMSRMPKNLNTMFIILLKYYFNIIRYYHLNIIFVALFLRRPADTIEEVFKEGFSNATKTWEDQELKLGSEWGWGDQERCIK